LAAANELPDSSDNTIVFAEAADQDRFRRRFSSYDEVFSATVSKLVGQEKRGAFGSTVAFYPGCPSADKDLSWKSSAPIMILMSEDDDWAPCPPCHDLAARFPDEITLSRRAPIATSMRRNRLVKGLRGDRHGARRQQ
jgi:dienelactone hydrolase